MNEKPKYSNYGNRSVINLLFFANGEYSNPPIMSGGAAFALGVCKHWCKKINIKFFCSRSGKTLYESNNLNVDYIVTTPNVFKVDTGIVSYTMQYLSLLLRSIRKAFNYKPSSFNSFNTKYITVANSDILSDLLPAIIISKRLKTPLIICCHLIVPNYFFVNGKFVPFPRLKSVGIFLLQRIGIWLCKIFADYIFLSNEIMRRDFIKRFHYSPSKLSVMRYGVELAKINAITSSTGIIYSACWLGRFHAQKGIFDLIDIWQEVCQKYRTARLVIVGAGDQSFTDEIRNRVLQRQMQCNIDMVGNKPFTQKFEIFKSSKVFLFPSHYESYGVVALEAMACKLPVVAYDLAEHRVNFTKGMIRVPFGDKKAFAEKTIELLESTETYNKYSNDAFEFASNADWEIVADELLEKIKVG